jgi:hypothetical protein
MAANRDEKPAQDEAVLLRFLQRTKDGKYAPIDPSSLQFVRMKEQTETAEQEYYYGLS